MKSFKELQRNLKKIPEGLPRLSVSLLGDSATQFLATAIKGEGIERGYEIDLFEAEYNQVERQVMDGSSDLYKHKADYTIIFQSSHKLLSQFTMSNGMDLADNRLAFVRLLCKLIPGRIIYYNYPEIGDGTFGSYANKVPHSFIYQVRKLNLGLMDLAREYPSLYICDLSEIQAKYGRDSFFESSIYINADMLLSMDALPIVASRTMDIISALEGKFKKCLILDLDNTLWGGVVGDDGWENVQVDHSLGIGKAFSEFQQWVKRLKDRGIIICICSKNDEDKAKEPFVKNDEMILKLDDIAVFIANWENKADNIRTIQRILNIGFDAMVFIDDNPFERNMVKENVPGITVPEMPEDPGNYLEFLYGLNLFETASYSSADKDRTQQYQVEARRVSLAKSFTNEADFLRSLDMVSEVKGFDNFNTPRVAQLSQRSNQFNLRTVRYTEEQVRAMSADNHFRCFAFTLSDKFGDNGLIAVVILEKMNAETLFINTWFMSCRVLKRGMEAFTLNTLAAYARENGFKTILGEYLPTLKNSMVKDLLPSLGFTPENGSSSDRYVLDVDTYTDHDCYISSK